MLSDAMSYPSRGGDSMGTLLIGGALTLLASVPGLIGLVLLPVTPVGLLLLGTALVPSVVWFGYLLRVLSCIADGDDDPPSFTDWGLLVGDGIKGLVIVGVYTFPIVVLAIVATVLVVLGSRTDYFSLFVGVGMLVALLLLVVAVVIGYVLPIGLAGFARRGRLQTAFSPRLIGTVGADTRYLSAWLLAQAIFLVGLGVALPLSLFVVGFVLAFYVVVSGTALIGIGVDRAATTDGRERIRDETAPGEGPVEVTEFVADVDRRAGSDTETGSPPEVTAVVGRRDERTERRSSDSVDRTEFVAGVDDESRPD